MLEFKKKRGTNYLYAISKKVTYTLHRNRMDQKYYVRRAEADRPTYDSFRHSKLTFSYEEAVRFAQTLEDGGYDWQADVDRLEREKAQAKAEQDRQNEDKKEQFVQALLNKGLTVQEFLRLYEVFEDMSSEVINRVYQSADAPCCPSGQGRGLRARFLSLRPAVSATMEECNIVMGYLEGHGYALAADLVSGTLYRLDIERISRTGNLLTPPVLYTLEEAVEFALDMNEVLLEQEETEGKAAVLEREGDILRKLLQRMGAENKY